MTVELNREFGADSPLHVFTITVHGPPHKALFSRSSKSEVTSYVVKSKDESSLVDWMSTIQTRLKETALETPPEPLFSSTEEVDKKVEAMTQFKREHLTSHSDVKIPSSVSPCLSNNSPILVFQGNPIISASPISPTSPTSPTSITSSPSFITSSPTSLTSSHTSLTSQNPDAQMGNKVDSGTDVNYDKSSLLNGFSVSSKLNQKESKEHSMGERILGPVDVI